MKGPKSRTLDRAAEMRLAFDRGFAEPAQVDMAPQVDLLGIRSGSDAYAIRLSELAGLFTGKVVTRLPGSVPMLLGIAGFRGVLLPVYDLPAFLGQPSATTPRWMVVAKEAALALAFNGFDGYLRVAKNAILPRADDLHANPYVQDFANTGDIVRPIAHLPSIIKIIKSRTSTAA